MCVCVCQREHGVDQAAEWTLDHVVDGELPRAAALFGDVQCAVSAGDSKTKVSVRSQVVVSSLAQQKKMRLRIVPSVAVFDETHMKMRLIA